MTGGPSGDLRQVQCILDEVFESYGVALAYLYGSQARGDAGPLSDVAVLFGPDVPESDRFSRVLHLIGEPGSVFHRDDVSVVDLAACKPVRSCSSRATDRRRTSWSMSR